MSAIARNRRAHINSDKHEAIFITGSSSGLGRAAAKLFASRGWKVIATIRIPNSEKELTKMPGVTLMALDTTDPLRLVGTNPASPRIRLLPDCRESAK